MRSWPVLGIPFALVAAWVEIAWARGPGSVSEEAIGVRTRSVPCEARAAPLLTWFDRSDGLPQSSVTALVASRAGYLELATFAGWARFDGRAFRSYDLRSLGRIPEDRLTGLAEAPDGSIWLLTQSGSAAQWSDGVTRAVLPPAWPRREAAGIVVDGQGAPWVRLFDGSLHQWDGSQWRARGPGQSESMLPCLGRLASGEVIACGEGRIEWWSPKGALERTIPFSGKPGEVLETELGDVWIVEERGLYRIGREGAEGPYRPELPAGSKVQRAATSGNRFLLQGPGWIAAVRRPDSREGTPKLETEWTHRDPRLLQVRSVASDPAGRFWIGTDGFGLLRVGRPEAARVCPEPIAQGVTGLLREEAGFAWVAMGCRGLVRIPLASDGPLLWSELFDARGSVCVQALARGAAGELWLGAGRQAIPAKVAPGGKLQLGTPVWFDSNVVALAQDALGLWVATQGGELRWLGKGEHAGRSIDAKVAIRRIARDPAGRLWVASLQGAGIVAGDQVRWLVQGADLAGAEARDLVFRGPDLWIVTYGRGLGRLRAGRFQWVEVPFEGWDNHLSALFEDSDGHVWLLGNRGVTVTSWPDVERGLEGRWEDFNWRQLGVRAGIPEGNFGYPNGFFDSAGRLWIATVNGLVRMEPPSFLRARESPRPELLAWSGGGRQFPRNETPRLPWGSTLRFELSVPDLDGFEPHRLEYRVIPGLQAWQEAPGPMFELQRLPAGAQRLEVRARNPGELGSEPIAVAQWIVEPRLFDRPGFQIGLGLGVLLLGAVAERTRRRFSERRRAEIGRERRARVEAEERAAQLRKDLDRLGRLAVVGEVSAALTHELTQPLGAVGGTLEALKMRIEKKIGMECREESQMLDEAVEQLHRASAIVRRYRAFLRPDPRAQGRFRIDEAIEEVLHLLHPRLQALRIEFSLELGQNLPELVGERLLLEQALLNLLNNACDALASWSGARRLALAVRREKRKVRIEVRDSGPGIPRDRLQRLFEPLSSDRPEGMGMGLIVSRQSVEQLGGEIRVETAGGGTTFVLILPGENERQKS